MINYNNYKNTIEALTDQKRKVGIELEFDAISDENLTIAIQAIRELGVDIAKESYNHNTRNYWKIVTDASLRGRRPYELVSPPLAPLEMARQLSLILDKFSDRVMEVNYSMGFHIHHECPRFSPKRLKYLVNHFVKNEANFDSIVSPSRRSSQWCASNKRLLKTSINSQGVNDEISRYHKLNLQCFSRYGTVEIRQHQATLNWVKIVNWMIFTQALVTRSYRKVTETDGYDNPMHNYILASKWATEYKGGLMATSQEAEHFLLWLRDRMEHYGVQKPFTMYTRQTLSQESQGGVIHNFGIQMNEDYVG